MKIRLKKYSNLYKKFSIFIEFLNKQKITFNRSNFGDLSLENGDANEDSFNNLFIILSGENKIIY